VTVDIDDSVEGITATALKGLAILGVTA
ncbi:gluconokinase, partial [Rhizobium ruizarguesonis]